MNNDLISRKALKETFENLASDSYESPLWYEDTVFRVIDNAPTVKPGSWSEGYHEGFQVGSELGKTFSRPQGEWIYHTNGYTEFYTCNKCNKISNSQDKFCKHCGADMRGEKDGSMGF